MAKKMNYKDPSGVIHTDSIWIPLTINISHLDSCGRVEFFGFKDKKSAILAILNHPDKVKPLYGAMKGFDFSGEKYNDVITSLVNKNLDTYMDCLSEACYLEIADKIKDVKNENGEMVGFFDNAVDISLKGD